MESLIIINTADRFSRKNEGPQTKINYEKHTKWTN